MSTEHEPEEITGTPEAEASGAADGSTPESAPEGAVAVEEQPEEAVDPLAGKSDAEIRELAAQAGEYLGLAQRSRADFDNYRKRAQRDLAAARVRGSAELARELLPAIDNAERAIEHESAAVEAAGDGAGEPAVRLLDALRGLHDELIAALARGGVERFVPDGEPFDPTRHEAMAKRPADAGEDAGICRPVFQAGYAAGEEIIRPARVVVTE